MTQPPADDPPVPDDRSLLSAHVAGDPDAFGTLFRRHRDRLWAVALRTTGDPESAADALQDAMVSAFRRAESYRGDAAVTTWLHRIVVNSCLDRIRREKVRAAGPLPDDLEEYAGRGAVSTSTANPGTGEVGDPADVVLAGERRQAVAAALAVLPVDMRVALVLVDMQGYPVEEAALILDCAPGTVKSRCSRGRRRLAPLLAGLLGETAGEASSRPPATTGPAGEPQEQPARPSSGARGGGEQR